MHGPRRSTIRTGALLALNLTWSESFFAVVVASWIARRPLDSGRTLGAVA